LFDARILTFQKKFIIRVVVVGSLGLKPWTLNPKKPSMRTLGLSTLCLFLVILLQDDNRLTKYVSIVQVVHYFTLHKTIFCTLKWKNNYVHFLSPNFLQRKNLGTWFMVLPNKNEVFALRGGGLFQVPPKEIDFFKWKLKERIRAMNFFSL